jgi:hypothetical protein
MSKEPENLHPRFEKRLKNLEGMRQAESSPGVRVVPYEEMNVFGKRLFEADETFQIEIDPGEFEYTYASDQVKSWQAQYREAKSPELKAKLKKRIDDNTGIPYSKGSHYLALRYIAETDDEIKARIKDQMYDRDHIFDIPEDLDAAIADLMTAGKN